jgi:DNA-directed RNA polymerase specialized sigma24 family protein
MNTSRSIEFEPWYKQEYPRTLATLVLVVGDGDLAREAADEAFARALARWRSVGGMDSPAGWTYRVALNLVRRSARRTATERRLLWSALPEGVVPAPATELWDVVRRLPRRQREVVVLRYLLDLREREIAEVLGIRRGTVSRSLAAAHATLRGWLSEESESQSESQSQSEESENV